MDNWVHQLEFWGERGPEAWTKARAQIGRAGNHIGFTLRWILKWGRVMGLRAELEGEFLNREGSTGESARRESSRTEDTMPEHTGEVLV